MTSFSSSLSTCLYLERATGRYRHKQNDIKLNRNWLILALITLIVFCVEQNANQLSNY